MTNKMMKTMNTMNKVGVVLTVATAMNPALNPFGIIVGAARIRQAIKSYKTANEMYKAWVDEEEEEIETFDTEVIM